MVDSGNKQLERLLSIRQQKSRLLDLELSWLDTSIRSLQSRIERLQSDIDRCDRFGLSDYSLPHRGAFLGTAVTAIAEIRREIDTLTQRRSETNQARRRIEQESEALASYLARRGQARRRRLRREEQVRVLETLGLSLRTPLKEDS